MVQTSQEQVARKQRFGGDDGATLVEFAIISPVLFMVIFAIIEFGWAFGQHLDVRHGAREGSRLVAVNYGQDDSPPLTGGGQTDAIVAQMCGHMDLPGTPEVTLEYLGGPEVGEFALITVENDLETITGFLDFALDNITLSSSVETRIERGFDNGTDDVATWAAGTRTC